MQTNSRIRAITIALAVAIVAVVSPLATGRADAQIVGSNDLTAVDTRTGPARSIVRISFDGNRVCTGFLISGDTVATAGHCIYPGNNSPKYPVSSYRVSAGYDGRLANPTPYGTCTARQTWAHPSWIRDGAHEFDYGIVKLNCRVGDSTGTFGLRVSTVFDTLVGASVTLSGYPGDAPYDTTVQYRSTGKVIDGSHLYNIWYTNDMLRGQSGSPVYQPCGTRNCAVAIVSYYPTYNPSYNAGVRITPRVRDDLMAWATA